MFSVYTEVTDRTARWSRLLITVERNLCEAARSAPCPRAGSSRRVINRLHCHPHQCPLQAHALYGHRSKRDTTSRSTTLRSKRWCSQCSSPTCTSLGSSRGTPRRSTPSTPKRLTVSGLAMRSKLLRCQGSSPTRTSRGSRQDTPGRSTPSTQRRPRISLSALTSSSRCRSRST